MLSTWFSIRLGFDIPLSRASLVRQIDFTVNNGLVFPLTVSGFAIGIKMGKNFYLQQIENSRLAKQKINAQVQLLKNKTYPRFLFHALNSLYKDMINGAMQSPEMLLKLSDLLSYILYESDNIMPLDKEISLLKSYIDLEKISRGKKLVAEIEDETETSQKYIEPLLLLSLIECVFAANSAADETLALLNIKMQTVNTTFFITVMYKASNIKSCFKEDEQLMQLEKRIQSQYKGKHDFKVMSDEGTVTIFLSLVLNDVTEDIIHPLTV